jgi:hypothetical protein
MKAIIPVLTEGMIDVWRVGPTDPVDYLADYIFKKSNECARWLQINKLGNYKILYLFVELFIHYSN